MKEIFILDDDGSMREVLTRFIEKQGYKVRAFSSPEEAFPEILAGVPDLLISDINMPGMNGIEMAGKIREKGEAVPIILLSADICEEYIENARELGIRHVFPKPLDLTVLKESIEEELTYNASEGKIWNYSDVRMKFLVDLSHEIRTPLTAIKLALDGLSDGRRIPKPQAKLLSISRRNLDRIISLVEDELETLRTKLTE